MNKPGSFKKVFEWEPFIKTGIVAALVAKVLVMGADHIFPALAPWLSRAL